MVCNAQLVVWEIIQGRMFGGNFSWGIIFHRVISGGIIWREIPGGMCRGLFVKNFLAGEFFTGSRCRLWFGPPWLTHIHTDRQTAF